MINKCEHVFESVKNIDTKTDDLVCKNCGLIKPKKYRANYFETLIKKYGRNK